FDILGLDSCQMSMAEVAFEVSDAVNFMVGSEGFQPNTGWPYKQVLGLLPDYAGDPEGFARNIVNQQITYYLDFAGADLSTDISPLDLNRLRNVLDGLKSFTKALGAEPKLSYDELKKRAQALKEDETLLNAIVLAHRRAQGFKREQYSDLWDF